MSGTWCTLHDDETDWHWTIDMVGVIPALGRLDGTWEPDGDAIPQDRGCALRNGINPERITAWPVNGTRRGDGG